MGRKGAQLDANAGLKLAIDLLTRWWPVAVGIGVIAFPLWRMVRARQVEIKRHKDAGTIGPASVLQGASLPWHYDRLAGVGSAGEPARTLDDRILRPSIGVKLFVVGLAAVVFVFTFMPEFAPDGWNESLKALPISASVTQILLMAVAIIGVFHIFGHEARYNRDLLITTRMFLSRREFRWKDLQSIGDDGAYELVLTFTGNRKAKVLKHSRGIADFKLFAQEQLRRTR